MSCVVDKLEKSLPPKVSIIVPVYNSEEFVSETLDCLLKSSLKEIEIVCVNDGSSDNSLAILEQYKKEDPRIVVIDKVINEGLSEARNTGIFASKGEYIAFCDADDLVDKNFYEKLYVSAISTGADLSLGKVKNIPYQVTNFEFYEKLYDLIKQDKRCCIGPLVSFLIKKELIISNNLKFKKVQASEEFNFCLQLGMVVTTVSFVTDAFYYYRLNINEKSITNKGNFKLDNYKFDKNLLESIEEMYSHLSALNIDANTYSLACSYIFVDKCSIIQRCSKGINKYLIIRSLINESKKIPDYQCFTNSVRKLSPLMYSYLNERFLLIAFYKNTYWYYSYLFNKAMKKLPNHSFVWGYSEFFKRYAKNNKKYLCKLDGIIDLAAQNCPEMYDGKTIYSPDCLRNFFCEAIIIGVTHHQNEIYKSINNFLIKYNICNVKVICWLE